MCGEKLHVLDTQWILFQSTIPFGFRYSFIIASFSAIMVSVWYWFGWNKNFQSLSGVFKVSILGSQPFRYKREYKLTSSKLGYGMRALCNRRSPIIILLEIWPKVISCRVLNFNQFHHIFRNKHFQNVLIIGNDSPSVYNFFHIW